MLTCKLAVSQAVYATTADAIAVKLTASAVPCAAHPLLGEASLLLVVFVMLPVKLSCMLSMSALRNPLGVARGGRLSLLLRISAGPEADGPLQTRHLIRVSGCLPY